MSITSKSVKPAGKAGTADPDGKKEDKLAPATDVAASGALIEPAIVDRIDTTHPSVDDEPRKGATKDMNRIDFNDPSGLTPPEESVEKNLKDAD